MGDAKVYSILATQGFGNFAQGATLTKLCSIRSPAGRGGYDLYWLELLTQAAMQIHGSATIIAISQSGNVLGSYDSDMEEDPRCTRGTKLVRTVDGVAHQTHFAPGALPRWLGGGSGFFFPSSRYEGKRFVDGVKMPKPIDPR